MPLSGQSTASSRVTSKEKGTVHTLSTAEQIRRLGAGSIALKLDVTDSDAVRSVVDCRKSGIWGR